MPLKDYYVVLGISPDETQAGIKSAYRDLARRYHPDRAGAKSTKRFQEVSEAYNVLGDRERRTAYDASRRRAPVEPVEPRAVDPRVRAPVEPLDMEPEAFRDFRSPPTGTRRWSIMDDFINAYAIHDEIFDHFRRNFTESSPLKSGRTDALNLGIHLTHEEARRGAEVELGVPVALPCRRCHGSGRIGLYACPRCRATGWFETEEYVALHIPPLVSDGTLIQVPLERLGIEDLLIRALIRVRD